MQHKKICIFDLEAITSQGYHEILPRCLSHLPLSNWKGERKTALRERSPRMRHETLISSHSPGETPSEHKHTIYSPLSNNNYVNPSQVLFVKEADYQVHLVTWLKRTCDVRELLKYCNKGDHSIESPNIAKHEISHVLTIFSKIFDENQWLFQKQFFKPSIDSVAHRFFGSMQTMKKLKGASLGNYNVVKQFIMFNSLCWLIWQK